MVRARRGGAGVGASFLRLLLGHPAVDRGERARRVEVVGERRTHARTVASAAGPLLRDTASCHRFRRASAAVRSSACPLPVAAVVVRDERETYRMGSTPSVRSLFTNTRLPRDFDIFAPSYPTMPAWT
jgi:hypothetical protein